MRFELKFYFELTQTRIRLRLSAKAVQSNQKSEAESPTSNGTTIRVQPFDVTMNSLTDNDRELNHRNWCRA